MIKHYSIVALAFLLSACTTAPQQGDTVLETRVLESNTITTSAAVIDIDYEERSVTIENQNRIVVLYVTPEVTRFDDIKVGDFVTTEYTETVAVHVQTQDGETRIQTSGDLDKAKESVDAMEQVQVVSDILAIDTTLGNVTLKQPHGGELTLPVEYPENLHNVSVGDQVVMTYTKAVIISIDNQSQEMPVTR
ncbi:hypothetical protein [Vibrio superstes]|uniref:Lipoprotein n=1 Tax=Vibrio superstes NBRC 103154 TaxID=1219062 RepID=A0A511QWM5_9VIBR|nr:hypothetical protein [Vibrio superstes]GEM81781.1 hypothetical protein VSU01S_40260 [Vibrio superstes NBRC 103154]